MGRLSSTIREGFLTGLNIWLYALTFGRFIWLEGRLSGGKWRNWIRDHAFRPAAVARPTTEEEIVQLVQGATRLRVVGSGHSFNANMVTDGTLVTLDDYTGVVAVDRGSGEVTVRAGMRMRDVSRALLKEGLAFAAMPSHDAQSAGGILSTDVHGTGRAIGFVSQQVTRLKIVDGCGEVHTVGPDDDLYRAAIGGVGAVGVIVEVTFAAVPRFTVRQKVESADRDATIADWDRIFAANDHASVYMLPFSDRCQINTWNRTTETRSFAGNLREFFSISIDASLVIWVGNLVGYVPRLRKLLAFVQRIKRGSNLVMESFDAFNRSIYHSHQELEFAVDREKGFEVWERVNAIYEDMAKDGMPFMLAELRFTPEDHDRTLLGPARGGPCCYIELVINRGPGWEAFYGKVEELMREVGGRMHLGKWIGTFERDDVRRSVGQPFDRFVELRDAHDPDRKFANAFTRRILGD